MDKIMKENEQQAEQQINSLLKKSWVKVLLIAVLISFFAVIYFGGGATKEQLSEVVVKSKEDWPKVLKDLSEEAGNNMQVEKGF